MTKHFVYCHVTELRPEHFEGTPPARPSPLATERFKVTSVCAQANADSADVWTQVQALKSPMHRRAAIAALLMLVKVAQGGRPLTDAFDKKAMHETHTFRSRTSGKIERIWRYRKGDIRVLFYYALDKVVLLSGVLIKLRDRLTEAEILAAENAVERFLEAQRQGRLRWV